MHGRADSRSTSARWCRPNSPQGPGRGSLRLAPPRSRTSPSPCRPGSCGSSDRRGFFFTSIWSPYLYPCPRGPYPRPCPSREPSPRPLGAAELETRGCRPFFLSVYRPVTCGRPRTGRRRRSRRSKRSYHSVFFLSIRRPSQCRFDEGPGWEQCRLPPPAPSTNS